MKIKLPLITAIAGILLTGCVSRTPAASMSATHGLTLASKSSAKVKVSGPRLQTNHGNLELAGSVSKNLQSGTTAFSHLDVLFCDGTGRVLLTKPIRFSPQSVGHSRFASQRAYYSLNVDELPAGTARIEVQAHDADLTAPHHPSQS